MGLREPGHHDFARLRSILSMRWSLRSMFDLVAAIKSSWSEMARSRSANWALSGSTARSVTLKCESKSKYIKSV